MNENLLNVIYTDILHIKTDIAVIKTEMALYKTVIPIMLFIIGTLIGFILKALLI